MDYPHAIDAPQEDFDRGFVVGFSEASLGVTVDPDLEHYYPDFTAGYRAGRLLHGLLHRS